MNTIKNSVQLIGRIGMQPEIKTAGNGNKYAKFTLATSERYTNKNGEKVEDTTWHNITLWDKQAELAEKYMVKGQEIALQAKLVNNSYTDATTGKVIKGYELKVHEVMLLARPGNAAPATQPNTTAIIDAVIQTEDLPF
jgi:single-strand DNA-binding protein